MPKASTKIGSKLENCDLAMIENPKNDEKLATWPIMPCIQSNAAPRATITIPTSVHLRKLTYSKPTMTKPIRTISPALDCNSRLTSTFTPCPTSKVIVVRSLERNLPSKSMYDHSLEQPPLSSCNS